MSGCGWAPGSWFLVPRLEVASPMSLTKETDRQGRLRASSIRMEGQEKIDG